VAKRSARQTTPSVDTKTFRFRFLERLFFVGIHLSLGSNEVAGLLVGKFCG
jgi:hypothetical protein